MTFAMYALAMLILVALAWAAFRSDEVIKPASYKPTSDKPTNDTYDRLCIERDQARGHLEQSRAEVDRLHKLNGHLSTLLGEVREKLSQEQVRLKRMEREIGVPSGTSGNDTMETRVEARGQDVRVKIANLESAHKSISADNERLRSENRSIKARAEEAEARIANALT